MRTSLLLLKLLLATAAAGAAVFFAVTTVDLNGIYPTNWTDADLIRQRCHIRLIQPEWVCDKPDTVMNWVTAELTTRMGLIAILWLASLSVIIWNFARNRKVAHVA